MPRDSKGRFLPKHKSHIVPNDRAAITVLILVAVAMGYLWVLGHPTMIP